MRTKILSGFFSVLFFLAMSAAAFALDREGISTIVKSGLKVVASHTTLFAKPESENVAIAGGSGIDDSAQLSFWAGPNYDGSYSIYVYGQFYAKPAGDVEVYVDGNLKPIASFSAAFITADQAEEDSSGIEVPDAGNGSVYGEIRTKKLGPISIVAKVLTKEGSVVSATFSDEVYSVYFYTSDIKKAAKGGIRVKYTATSLFGLDMSSVTSTDITVTASDLTKEFRGVKMKYNKKTGEYETGWVAFSKNEYAQITENGPVNTVFILNPGGTYTRSEIWY